MILTLIASGSMLSCLCVAPISSAPSHFDRTGFTPVQIKIEQIRPISVDNSPSDGDLQADVSDSDDSPIASSAKEGEITINLAPPEMQGSIPVSNYRGARRMADRLNRVALARRAKPTLRDVVAKAPEVSQAKSETYPTVSVSDGSSDEAAKLVPGTEHPASDVDSSGAGTEPLRLVKPSLGEISGAYVCSYASAEKLTRLLDEKYPDVHPHLGGTAGLRTDRGRNQLRAILVHGPPHEVASALEVAQHLDITSRKRAAN